MTTATPVATTTGTPAPSMAMPAARATARHSPMANAVLRSLAARYSAPKAAATTAVLSRYFSHRVYSGSTVRGAPTSTMFPRSPLTTSSTSSVPEGGAPKFDRRASTSSGRATGPGADSSGPSSASGPPAPSR